jgi:proline iminopeptidase
VLHGGPGLGHTYLRPALDRLADEFRLIYWDQRGSGATPVGDEQRLNLAGAVDDVRGLLDGLGIERANLIGHSYGGDLAALFATHHPDRIGKMVIANPGPPFDMPTMEEMSHEMRRRRTPELAADMARIRSSPEFAQAQPAAIEEYIRLLFLPFFNDPAVGRSTAYELNEYSAPLALEGEEKFFSDFDYTREATQMLDRVTAPVLVVYGDTDGIPESFSQMLAERMPGGRFQRLAGASHFAYLEQPDAFFGAVIPFLREKDRDG